MPRRSFLVVSSENQRSTRFSHELLVGVKCGRNRGWASSQRWKQKLAYYLKNSAAGTSVKFTQPAGASFWVPTKQEGTVANQTVGFSYQLGKLVEFPVTGEGSVRPQEIIVGPDGNFWFLEGSESNKVGKITRSGTITKYTILGAAGLGLVAIGAGPDGNIWVAADAGGLTGP